MKIGFSNRLAVAFANLTGRKISTKMADHLVNVLLQMESVDNVPGNVIQALRYKASNNSDKQIKVTVALNYIDAQKKQDAIESRLDKDKNRVNYTRWTSNSFLTHADHLSDSVYKLLENDDVKDAIALELMTKHNLNIHSSNNLAAKLNKLQAEFNDASAQLASVEQKIFDCANKLVMTAAKHLRLRFYDAERTELWMKITSLEDEIPEVESALHAARYNKAKAVMDVAIRNENRLSPECQGALNQLKDLYKQVEIASTIIDKAQTEIHELQLEKDDAANYTIQCKRLAEQVQGINNIEEVKKLVKSFDPSKTKTPSSTKMVINNVTIESDSSESEI